MDLGSWEEELGRRTAFHTRMGEAEDQPLQIPRRGWSLNSCPSPSPEKRTVCRHRAAMLPPWGPSQPPDRVTRWGTFPCHFAPAMLSEHPKGPRVSGPE